MLVAEFNDNVSKSLFEFITLSFHIFDLVFVFDNLFLVSFLIIISFFALLSNFHIG